MKSVRSGSLGLKHPSSQSSKRKTLPSDFDVGRSGVLVTSAVTLNEAEKERIKHLVENLSSKKFNYRYEINKEVLGGLRIELGDLIIDTSLKNALSELTELLKS